LAAGAVQASFNSHHDDSPATSSEIRPTSTIKTLPLPSALHHHQRVIATRWLVPAASIISLCDSLPGSWASITLPPPTSHRDSLAGSCSLHQPSQLIAGSLGLHHPSTTTNESSRLVGWFLQPPSAFHHHRVLATRWWLLRPPSALHHHQRVLATRWWLLYIATM
jgi:hypothetical protein